jgi:hypothetical protein
MVIVVGIFIFSSFASAAEDVIINGNALTEEQIGAFEEVYGAKPQPGNYWYASCSWIVPSFFRNVLQGHAYTTSWKVASS